MCSSDLDLVTANMSSNTVSVLLAMERDGPALRRATSTASEAAVVAPGSLATLYPWSVEWNGPSTGAGAAPPWPTILAGISLEVRDSQGESRLAPLTFASSYRINFQVPDDTAPGQATLWVDGFELGTMWVEPMAPGLFMACPVSDTPSALGVLVEPDGSQVPVPVFSDPSNPPCRSEPVPLSAAGARPLYVEFYGTGFRGATVENVTCYINGMQMPVVYAGPQSTTPGLDQINVRVLPDLLLKTEEGLVGPGPVTVTLRIGGIAANSAVVDLR